ncbi:MAG: tripartite tricarboxylate transporter substrate binding protein [Burkholderiales bacterium]|jgi:tripartite-type tricarboxylate transporter receptor subunit TctC|nr:tripartite tricarboxylate transporter substrate binding protein [Burkholderiales bacterium]
MRSLFLTVFAAAFALSAQAADYPNKPIRVLVPFAPGGVVDTSARILTMKISEDKGWQFVVDNRPGANGFIATGTTARATPDGYTLLAAHTGEMSVNPVLFKEMPYNVERDFTPIIMVSDAPMLVVVNAASPFNTLKDLIAGAKAKPGQLTFGSPGTGSVNHMATEWLVAAAGAKALHVPYKGGAPAVSAVASNEVVFTVAGLPGVLPHLQAKRVKVLGVTTAKRSPQVPDYMSAQEAGIPGVDASIWVGLFAPKGTPKDVVAKLYEASAAALRNADVKKRYATVGGAETTTMGTEAFTKRIRSELERYRKVAAEVGLQPQ